MSFLSWFGKKEASRESVPTQTSDLGQVDATVPTNRLAQLHFSLDKGGDFNSRRNERLERRELLYGVVRECMTASGVLSSTYKFKVLSLDSSGRKYMIMVDMPREYLESPSDFVDTEGAIARSAKERYDILVTAVYWRVNEMVSANVASGRAGVVTKPQPLTTPDTSANTKPAAVAQPYAELQAEEVLAFKRAVAAAASGAVTAQRSETRRVARRNSAAVQDFSNTEPFEAPPPLSTSQFGGIN
jgi:hypothetical protein